MENEKAAVVSVDEGVNPCEAVQTDGAPAIGSTPINPNLPPELQLDKDGNPPELTPRLFGKLRARYFTVKHPRLDACGHRFDLTNEPRNNCETCWVNFFAYHPTLVETADQFFRTQGKGPLIAMRGAKFVRYFTRYMATLYHEQQLKEQQNGTQDNQPRSTQGIEAGEVNSAPGTE
jgi:predicted  nucleic acid-binding Zn-ribbon protein